MQALVSLCTNNTRNQDSVRECGGVPTLVALMAPARPADVHTRAANALTLIARDSARGREAVRACGGAAALERVLGRASSAAAHEWAAAALRHLGQPGGRDLGRWLQQAVGALGRPD